LGDRLKFNYQGVSFNQGWDVITAGGSGDGKFIQRATYINIEQKADGTEVINKKHIVKIDFLQSISDFS